MASFTLLPVEDASEEIFLLFTEKHKASADVLGLGFVRTNAATLPISLTVRAPPSPLKDNLKVKSKRSGAKGAHTKAVTEVTVEFELSQDLTALRNRPGDTGSVLWRVSLHLAQFLLAQHHFPTSEPIFPSWTTSTVLELGSGSGFLGLALGPTVKRWIFSDQLTSLDLVLKNLRRNKVEGGDVREIDWLVEEKEWKRQRQSAVTEQHQQAAEPPPDIILAADCIYNPSISAPLAHTIDLLAGPQTMVLVVSELRDEDPLEVFLSTWTDLPGWSVSRVVLPENDPSGLGSQRFVVWLGNRAGT